MRYNSLPWRKEIREEGKKDGNKICVMTFLESRQIFKFVMPELIRHPETAENTGFRLSPE